MSVDRLEMTDTTAELLAEAVADGASPTVRVRGRCMEPLLRDGDRLELAAIVDPPRPGELLVAVSDDGALVCHRVLARRGESVLLAGDGTRRAELSAPPRWVGRVVAAERSGRRLPLDGATSWLDPLLARLHPATPARRVPGRSLSRLRTVLLALIAARWHLSRGA